MAEGEWDWKDRNIPQVPISGLQTQGECVALLSPGLWPQQCRLQPLRLVSRDKHSPLSRLPILFWDRSDTPSGAASSEVKRGSFQHFPELQRVSQQGCELKPTVKFSICLSARAAWESLTFLA